MERAFSDRIGTGERTARSAEVAARATATCRVLRDEAARDR